MVVLSGKVNIKGKTFEIGGLVKDIDENCEYFGLNGIILEIRTGSDKETENEEDDILVRFFAPTIDSEIKELEQRFSDLYQYPKVLEDIIFEATMDAESLVSMNLGF